MSDVTLMLTGMAHGGSAVGRDKKGRPLFVPYAIPGETVQVTVHTTKNSYAHATLDNILKPSPDRVVPRCMHFGSCGGCHLQHMSYERQLQAKQAVVRDQLKRIGGFKKINVKPTIPHPNPWHYRIDTSLSPVSDGSLGFWSPSLKQVIPIRECHIAHPRLMELWQDIALNLPGLRKLTLRLGDDNALLAALEVDDVEPPQLEADFPVSVAMVLPDKTAASLVGEFYLVQNVKGWDFRVSPGCFFQPSPVAAALVVDTMLSLARLTGQELVLEGYSGVGMLTAFLSEKAASVVAVEANPDAVADTAVNLAQTENITLYQGLFETIVPDLELKPDVIVINPPAKGVTPAGLKVAVKHKARQLIYISSDVATLARDGKQLYRAGYKPTIIQPIDMMPQTFHIETVSCWVLR